MSSKSKKTYTDVDFSCSPLQTFYSGKTISTTDLIMSRLLAFNNYNMLNNTDEENKLANSEDLLIFVFHYHNYIPESINLFEYLLNIDIDINAIDRNTKGKLFTSLIIKNETKWLAKYMSSRHFDCKCIEKSYLFYTSTGNWTIPMQYAIHYNYISICNLLMMHGAIPYTGIESDLEIHANISSIVKLRELLELYKMIGITDVTEKLFAIYVKKYRLDYQVAKYFTKQKFNINYQHHGKNYLMLLISNGQDYEELLTWMIKQGIEFKSISDKIIAHIISRTDPNIKALEILVDAGLDTSSCPTLLEILTKKIGLLKCIELAKLIVPTLPDTNTVLNNLATLYVNMTYVQNIDNNILAPFDFDSNIIKQLTVEKIQKMKEFNEAKLKNQEEQAKKREQLRYIKSQKKLDPRMRNL